MNAVFGMALMSASGAGAKSTAPDPAKAYDDYVAQYTEQDLTFGRDAKVDAALEDFVKTFIDKFPLENSKIANLKAGLVNAYDMIRASQQSGEVSATEVMKFLGKSALPYVSPKEMVRLKKTLRLTNDQIKALNQYAPGLSEAGATSLGTATSGGGLAKASEEAVLGIIDTICPECAVARRGVLLAVEEGKAQMELLQDQRVRKEFELHLEDREATTFLVGRGFALVTGSARKKFRKIHGREPSQEELEKFIKATFDRWRDERRRLEEEAKVLHDVKQFYLDLDNNERRLLGRTEAERADAFGSSFLKIYKDLLRYRGDRPLTESKKRDVYRAAMFLFKHRDANAASYRKFFFDELGHLGWRKPPPEPSKEERAARMAHIRKRLSSIGHDKLLLVLEYTGIYLSKEEKGNLMNCLCRQARYGQMGTTQIYHPDTRGEYDERYACQHPGPPCIVEGFGCTRHPLPSDEKIWESCLAANPLRVEEDTDGNPVPGSGQRLDEMILEKLSLR